MANNKRRREEDHDSPDSTQSQTNGVFTIKDFMADFPPLKGPLTKENELPLPSTVLANHELQNVSNGRKPPFRSTFNVSLPLDLKDYDELAALNAPYNWMKKQYSHCIIPELGEEYDFAYESDTFYTLRDLHNARVRIREGRLLPDYIIHSLATRWLMLEEKGRPASDGYLAQGEIFVATCLPLSNDNDALKDYFKEKYKVELSAQHYIPRSKYSVHFVGQPVKSRDGEIQSVHVGSVLIRNTRTGHVIHIDTGTRSGLKDRAKRAGSVLKSWLEFQKEKRPDADLGPISKSTPLILDVHKETHSSLRSIHAPVSATLFLKRRITNWGDIKAFTLRSAPSSKTMANCALRSISGWLGLKAPKDIMLAKPYKKSQTFEGNYDKDALMGRQQPAQISQRIQSAQEGEAPVYNDDAATDDEAGSDRGVASNNHVASGDEASDDEASVIPDTVHDSVSGDEDTAVVDHPDDDNSDKSPDDEVRSISDEDSDDDKPVTKTSPKKAISRSDPEPEESEVSEAENDNTTATQYATAIADTPKTDGTKKAEPKKNGSNKKRSAGDDMSDQGSDSARQARGKACGRNSRASV